MRIVYLSVFAFAVLLIQSCSQPKERNSATVLAKTKTTSNFKFATVIADQKTFTVTLPGELKAYEEVSVYPKIKGFIKKIYVDRGSYVRKGQLLARLEAPEVGAQFAASTSSSGTAYQKFIFSRQSYNRLKDAAKKEGAVATIELEKAYAQYLGDSASYFSSRYAANASGQMQNYLRIVAPFDGVITARNASEGALVGDNGINGAPVFQLVQENKLRLVVAIPEKQAQSLTGETKATFTVVDNPGKTFTASLSRNSNAIDAATKSLLAEFDFDNKNNLLHSGQYAKVKLQLQRPRATLWVPATSVVQAQSGVFVVKNANGLVKRIPVQTGLASDSLTEVFGELTAGDKVFLKGSEELKAGTKIGQ